MSQADFMGLMPVLVLSATVMVVMLAISVRRHHATAAVLAFAGLAIALWAIPCARAVSPRHVTTLLAVDRFGLFYMALLFLASMAVTVLSWGYFEKRPGYQEEYYLLLLMATLGGAVLVTCTHFASLFIGLELLTISLYAMVGYSRTQKRSIEAGLKYLVLASVSTAFLLFGMALIYAETGHMDFGGILDGLKQGDYRPGVLLAGLGMIAVAAGFKMALAPFHMWTPDVYEGAPAPVTAYVATVSKGAMTAVLLRLYLMGGGTIPQSLASAMAVIAILSMFVGNLLALLQDNVKRILAYSSIAHLGYLLVAFLAGGQYAAEAVTYYLAAYMVTTLGTFGVVSVLSDSEKEMETLRQYRGLYWKKPLHAGLFTTMLLSLAGIPLTAGFVGKFYLVAAGVDGGAWGLLICLVINSAIGLYYYLRIVASMYETEMETKSPAAPIQAALGGSILLALLTLGLIWLGVMPGTLIELIRTNVSRLL